MDSTEKMGKAFELDELSKSIAKELAKPTPTLTTFPSEAPPAYEFPFSEEVEVPGEEKEMEFDHKRKMSLP